VANIYYAAGFNGSGWQLNHWISLHCGSCWRRTVCSIPLSSESVDVERRSEEGLVGWGHWFEFRWVLWDTDTVQVTALTRTLASSP